jgi:hypothetical protein
MFSRARAAITEHVSRAASTPQAPLHLPRAVACGACESSDDAPYRFSSTPIPIRIYTICSFLVQLKTSHTQHGSRYKYVQIY